MKVSQELVKICGDSLEFMRGEAEKRNEERKEIRDNNTQLLGILSRIAASSEKMAAAVTPCFVVNTQENNI